MVYAYFMIVGPDDTPLYEAELADQKQQQEKSHLKQFIMNASLDQSDEIMWNTNNFYLKVVDKFNEYQISAYVTPGYTKFLIMQDFRPEDNVKSFFHDVYELYLKVLLNPFYEHNTPITSQAFHTRVTALLKKLF
eukprot:TRINITY_DN67796_c4_g2_i4.p1 TRINITY_DN67796_c4_g2~~TRINITY_DN67796_c4_g2_i4.p1  ORF type:complete len:135 (+),score=25.06 TRINITY_DN67796_c4_g2_i4:46-450(+)